MNESDTCKKSSQSARRDCYWRTGWGWEVGLLQQGLRKWDQYCSPHGFVDIYWLSHPAMYNVFVTHLCALWKSTIMYCLQLSADSGSDTACRIWGYVSVLAIHIIVDVLCSVSQALHLKRSLPVAHDDNSTAEKYIVSTFPLNKSQLYPLCRI